MNIYVASSWRNDYQPAAVQALRDDGHRVYDFKGHGSGWGDNDNGPGGFARQELDNNWKEWSSDPLRYLEALNHPRAIEGFNRDMGALMASDVCVMVMPCGPSASMEMGWASGTGLPTAVWIPAMREPDLMVKMASLITTDLDDIRSWARLHRDGIAYHRHHQQRRIGDWYRAAGGTARPLASMKRVIDEAEEMIADLEEGADIHAREEAADTAISLMVVCEQAGFDLNTAIRRKLAINDRRCWAVSPDGNLYHVPGSDPREAAEAA